MVQGVVGFWNRAEEKKWEKLLYGVMNWIIFKKLCGSASLREMMVFVFHAWWMMFFGIAQRRGDAEEKS
jgi:uncharacterized membrane protein HdeD (DUF308 family)